MIFSRMPSLIEMSTTIMGDILDKFPFEKTSMVGEGTGCLELYLKGSMEGWLVPSSTSK